MLTAHGVTHPGKVRERNEDAFFVDAELGVFIVADGMGGHNAGEVASKMAVDVVRMFLVRSRDGEDVTWPFAATSFAEAESVAVGGTAGPEEPPPPPQAADSAAPDAMNHRATASARRPPSILMS